MKILSRQFIKLIPSAIKYAVNLVIVAQPSSTDSPFTNEKSKFLISKDLSKEPSPKLSIAWLRINSSIFPDFATSPL